MPDIKVNLSSTGIQRVGETFQFVCEASGIHNLNPVITFSWINAQSRQVGTNSSIFSLQSVKLSDAGEYTCMVTISSTYLRVSLTSNASENLIIESKSYQLTCMHG